jgi:anti-sigma regulatory factor (Ser/Thr protein kinase)
MEFAAMASSVPDARRATSAFLVGFGVSDATILAIQLCVSELATNAVLHAYPGGGGRFEVAVTPNGETVRLEVTDQGVGFDQSDPRGLGLTVVGALSGGIDIERLDGSTSVTASIPLEDLAG